MAGMADISPATPPPPLAFLEGSCETLPCKDWRRLAQDTSFYLTASITFIQDIHYIFTISFEGLLE